MKKIITLSVGIVFWVSGFGQAPAWQWARSAGNIDYDSGNSVSTDASGNVYVTGSYANYPVTFGSIVLGNAGGNDYFIVKYDAAGNVLWAQSAGSGYTEVGMDVTTDASGNVYVTGQFSGAAITFGSITLSNTNMGGGDIFIAKYDASGNVLWAKHAGGLLSDLGRTIAVENNGVYVSGTFSGTSVSFGSLTLNTTGASDVFTAKYDTAGNVLWAKGLGGTSNDQPRGIAADASGNAYVTGVFQSPEIYFANDTLGDSISSGHIFIVKYDASGNEMWGRFSGGPGGDNQGTAIITDAAGNVFVTGGFQSSSITLGTTTLNSAGNFDIFLAKYSASGNVMWAQRFGGTSFDKSEGIAVDAANNIFIAGGAGTSVMFGSFIITSGGVFAAKLDTSGSVLWAKNASGSTYGMAIAVDAFSNASVTGQFEGTATFGNTVLTNTDTSGFVSDIFVARLSDIPTEVSLAEGSTTAFSLSPNPATNELTVKSSEFAVESVEVYDVVGVRCLRALTLNPSPSGEGLRLDVSSLASGIYFVKVKTEEGERVGKFVKQ